MTDPVIIKFNGDVKGLDVATGKAVDGLKTVGIAAAGVSVAIGGVFAKGTQEFIKFDDAIKQSGVVSGSTGTPELQALREEVERLGIVTSKAPAEIGEMSVALSRAGFTAEESTDALLGIVSASEATGESLLTVGDITAKTIRTFGLAAEDSERVADVLVATANNTNTTVSSIGESLSYVGAVAASSNQPLEDIAVAIGLLGDAGIQGSSAGTNLAAALQRLKIASAAGSSEFAELARGSAGAAKAFEIIGGQIRDSNGQLLPLSEILPIVREGIKDLAQEDKDILFKTVFQEQGGRAFQTLLNASEERINAVSDAINNSEGVARQAGQEMLMGLGGALDLLGGSASATAAKFGEVAAIGLEPLVRLATDILNKFLELPGPIQKLLILATGFTGVIAGAVAAVIGFNAAMAAAGPGLIALGTQLGVISVAGGAASISFTGLGLAIASAGDTALAAAAKMAPLLLQVGLAAGALGALSLALRESEGAQFASDITEATNSLVGMREESDQLADSVTESGTALERFIDLLRDQGPIAGLQQALAGAENAATRFGEANAVITSEQRGAQRAQIALEEVFNSLGSTVSDTSNLLLKYGENIPVEKQEEFAAAASEQADALNEEIDLLSDQLGQSEALDQQLNNEIAIRERLLETIKERLGADQAAVLEEESDAVQELTASLEVLQAATESAGAALDLSLNEQLQSIRQRQLDGVLSAEEAASAIAAVEQSASQDRIGILQEELAEVRELRRENADDPDLLQREQALAQEIGDIQLSVLEQQVQAQEQAQQDELNRIEEQKEEAIRAAEEQKKAQEELIKAQEEAEKARLQAELDAIEEARQARENAVAEQVRAINQIISAQERLNRSQQIQVELVQAASGLRSALDDAAANSLDLAARLTENEGERARITERAAELRVTSLERAQANEDLILNLQLAQERTQREIEASRLRAQQAQAQADIAAAEAQLQIAQAEGASDVQIQALQAQVRASREAASALELQGQELARQAQIQEAIASVRREQQDVSQSQALQAARVTAAEAQVNEGDRRRLLNIERELALRNADVLQRPANVPGLQQALALAQQQVASAQVPSLSPAAQQKLPSAQGTTFNGGVTINQNNTVEVRPTSTAAAETDFREIALNTFDQVAGELEGLARK